MDAELHLAIEPQPDDLTCGPTCLHAVFQYYGDAVPLPRVIAETPRLENGGTLAVQLACYALRRGYKATIYTYNLQVFDPTWFAPGAGDLRQKLALQGRLKRGRRLREATEAYLEFLDRGGRLRLEDLNPALIRRYLDRGVPILTGISANYLYRSMREYGPNDDEDDVRGEPQGHFVVLCGYHREKRLVRVADPFQRNPLSATHHYSAAIDRVIAAILLGVLTYDANLLIVEPGQRSKKN